MTVDLSIRKSTGVYHVTYNPLIRRKGLFRSSSNGLGLNNKPATYFSSDLTPSLLSLL